MPSLFVIPCFSCPWPSASATFSSFQAHFLKPILQVMMETEGCGNEGRQSKSQPWSWSGACEPGMKHARMYATGANPTLVQTDEHILVKGHRPGHRIVALYEWGMGTNPVPG